MYADDMVTEGRELEFNHSTLQHIKLLIAPKEGPAMAAGKPQH